MKSNTFVQKLLNKETAVESAVIMLAFTFIERIIQTVRGIVFARMLGPSEYGVYTLAFFFIPLVVTLSKLGIPSCYTRYVPQYEKKGMLGDFFRRNYIVTIGLGTFFTIFTLIFSKQISVLIFDSIEYKHMIILCALSILPYVFYDNILSSFKGMRVFKMGVLMRFNQFIVFTALGITLVFFYPEAKYIISANLVSFIFVVSVFGLIVWKYVLKSEFQNSKICEDDYYRKILKYSIWFIVLSVIDSLFKYTDRLMLNKFLGLEEVGIYSMALNIAQLLSFFGVIAGTVLMPNLSRVWENGEKNRVIALLNLSVKINVLLLLFIALIVSLFKGHVISILYGELYMKGLSVIDILLIYSLLSSIFWTMGGYAGIVEKTHINTIAMGMGFICNLALNYLLIPIYQLQGAAAATTISFTFSFIIINIWFYKEGFKLKLSTVFMYIIPFILLLNNVIMSIVYSLLIVIIFSTDFVITKDEKKILKQQVQKAFKLKIS